MDSQSTDAPSGFGEQSGSPIKAALWLVIAVIGLASPGIISSGWAPGWLEWLLKGSGGNGQSWQFLGAMSLGIALIEGLRVASVRFDRPALWRMSNWISGGFAGLLGLVGFAFAVLILGLLFGVLAGWLANIAPQGVAPYLRYLDHEPGSFVVSAFFSLAMLAAVARTYMTHRRDDPEQGRADAVIAAAYNGFTPFFLLAMIVMKAFVWVGLAIIALTHWIPAGAQSSMHWLELYERPIIASAMVLSFLAPFGIYAYRLRNNMGEDRPSFVDACWSVVWVLTGVGLLLLLVAVAISILASRTP